MTRTGKTVGPLRPQTHGDGVYAPRLLPAGQELHPMRVSPLPDAAIVLAPLNLL